MKTPKGGPLLGNLWALLGTVITSAVWNIPPPPPQRSQSPPRRPEAAEDLVGWLSPRTRPSPHAGPGSRQCPGAGFRV